MTVPRRTACCLVGGGPAGLMLGLVLARAGVRVTVLEKHGDFLRDFRGDTVHASTLTVLDELGLGETINAVPTLRYIQSLTAQLDAGDVPVADLVAPRSAQAHRPRPPVGLSRRARRRGTPGTDV